MESYFQSLIACVHNNETNYLIFKLTLQFMYDEFVEDYEPTKADSYRKKVSKKLFFAWQFQVYRDDLFYWYKLAFVSLGGIGWRGSSNRYSRYCWSGGLCGHSRQLFPQWWRISLRFFNHRRRKLPSNSGIPVRRPCEIFHANYFIN